MANLLNKLRIDYSSLTMLHGMSQNPSQSTIDMHSKMLDGFKEGVNKDYFIPDTERESLKEKTNRQLRLREFLTEHSKSASLIVMSLPMPRQVFDLISSCLNLFFYLYFPGCHFGGSIHVMARDAHPRHATIPAYSG